MPLDSTELENSSLSIFILCTSSETILIIGIHIELNTAKNFYRKFVSQSLELQIFTHIDEEHSPHLHRQDSYFLISAFAQAKLTFRNVLILQNIIINVTNNLSNVWVEELSKTSYQKLFHTREKYLFCSSALRGMAAETFFLSINNAETKSSSRYHSPTKFPIVQTSWRYEIKT